MAETFVDNYGNTSQMSSRRLGFEFVTQTSITSSHNMEVGLSVTVEAGLTIPASAKVAIQGSFKYGYRYTAGETKSERKSDALTANVEVPGRSSVKMLIIGHRMNIDVPYTATLEITYEDKTIDTKRITGHYNNVNYANFRVQYEEATPLRG